VLGILSLVLWSLVLVISVKYLGFVLRADNRGEGGILALVALAGRATRRAARHRWRCSAVRSVAALRRRDATPAISVLAAVEGLEVDGARPCNPS
jgi:KUP system potassium uptake protein